MSKIERYAGNLRAFGSNAQGLERTLFGETTQADDLTSQVTAAFLRGWGIVGPSENPSLEDFNAAMYAMSQFIAYQHQMGIPEWDASQEYYTGSLCVRGGETYSSLVNDNIGSAPPSAKWTPVLTLKNALSNLGLGDASGYVGRLINTRVFTSSDTYTPTPGTKRIRVTITGGGGGGGGCQASASNETFFGAGGGAGGTIISIMTLTEGSFSVVIGAGGSGGAGPLNGLNGGDSSFASLIAPGGAGGGKSGVSNTNGGAGGVPNIGDIRITGGDGGDGQSGNISVSGEGGASYWGGGGRAGAGGGVSGKAYGSGGGGAYDSGYSGTSMTGGKGAAGICIIEEFA
ncbi:hypothetical protein FHC77_19090 [Atlantibacter hermannii]|nr:hypothetical protein [Atlantibacter hermannii]